MAYMGIMRRIVLSLIAVCLAIPALADADALCKQLFEQPWAHEARAAGMRFAGLVLNERGFERLLRTALDSATLVVSCTEAHTVIHV